MNRHFLKRKSLKQTTESDYVESTYVPKPRYHQKRKSQKLVRWLAYITSDWQRLTFVTLIAMLVSGVGTVAILTLLGLSKVNQPAEPAIINTPAQQILSKRPESDASTERSVVAEKKSNDRGGAQVDNIAHSSRLRDVKPSPKSSERTDRLNPKKAEMSKPKTQVSSHPAKSFRSTSVSTKSIPTTKAVGAGKENSSGAKALPHTSLSSPSINTQRPRRVSGGNDQSSPASTSGRNTKAKVIQWP